MMRVNCWTHLGAIGIYLAINTCVRKGTQVLLAKYRPIAPKCVQQFTRIINNVKIKVINPDNVD